MKITRVWETKKGSFFATIDGNDMHVPKDLSNRHYAAIDEWLQIEGNEILYPEDTLSGEEYLEWIEKQKTSL